MRKVIKKSLTHFIFLCVLALRLAVYRERGNGARAAEATPEERWRFREVMVIHL